MAQFLVRVYPRGAGLRVVVDGITHFDAPSLDVAEARAREAVAERLRAYLPERAPPVADPDELAAWGYALRLERAPTGAADPPAPAPRPATGERAPRPAGGRRRETEQDTEAGPPSGSSA